MAIHWIEAQDRELLADAVTATILENLQAAIDADGEASLVVSGGSTPGPVFERLSRSALDWSAVGVTLADERWVNAQHADSNEALVRRTLLVDRAAAARFVPLYREAESPEAALADSRRAIALLPRPFSVVVLGMGGDGHTASLFPDAPDVQMALADDQPDDLVIMRPPSQSLTRISLTRRALLDARHRLLHITGDDKRAVLESAVAAGAEASDDDGERLPIARFFDAEGQGMPVYWSP